MTKPGRLIRLIAVVLIFGFTTAQTVPGSSARAVPRHAVSIDPRALEDIADGETGSFLVVMDQAAQLDALQFQADRTASAMNALQATAQASQRGAIAQLRSLAADPALDVRYRQYWIANVIAVWGKRPVLEAMAARPDVRQIASNRPFRVALEPAGPEMPGAAQGIEWNIARVHAPDLWARGITGQGITYANADTGVYWEHPALKPHYRGWNGSSADHSYNWWDAIHNQIAAVPNKYCPYSDQQPCDDQGHGTHVMGTGVGDDGAGNQIGMAPGAKWIACRNMDQGIGQPSAYMECLEFFIAPWDLHQQNPNPALHADVISNSYSCTFSEGCTAPGVLNNAIENVRKAGIFMAVSAGNDGPACSSLAEPPAVEPDVVTVGAVDSANQIASFSSRGPVTVDGSNRQEPDLVAPGMGVRSSAFNGGYVLMEGTSMAAPHVAGAVALIWSAYPPLRHQVQQTEDFLKSTAIPLYPNATQICGSDTTTSLPNNVYGNGLLNLSQVFDILFPYRYFFPIVKR